MALKITPKKQAAEDPRHIQAVQNYESGLRALQEHKFEKAKGYLQKVLSGPNKSFVDRAQVHILTCDKHLDTPALQFKTTEEHYDYAVSLINTGDYVAAREQFDKLLKQNPKADFVLYGLAALHCDFQNLAEDPRFTELLYPDPGAEESDPHAEESSAY